jgi:NAD(P)H dehydrogenase (quinone)
MVKVLIVYDSKTGHTEKMALAVAEGVKKVKGVNVEVRKVEQANIEDLLKADGVILGSPTYYGQMSAKLKKFIDKSVRFHGKLEGKVGAAFTSSGGTASGAETTILSMLQALLVHGMIVQGRADDKHYGAAAVGVPKEEDLKSCADLGKRVAGLVVRLKQPSAAV